MLWAGPGRIYWQGVSPPRGHLLTSWWELRCARRMMILSYRTGGAASLVDTAVLRFVDWGISVCGCVGKRRCLCLDRRGRRGQLLW